MRKAITLNSTRGKMNTPSRNEIWKMFDQISPTYDRVNRILSFGMDQRWRRKAASYLPLKKELTVLDLATGTADQLISLFESPLFIKKAVGIDLAKEMLLIGKKKISTKNYKDKIDLIEADATCLPFEAKSFDATTFSFGIRNVSDPMASLKEIYRVLKSDGIALILEFALPSFFPLRSIHLFYLRCILPRLGAFWSSNLSAYRYLNETIETFPQKKEFCSLMKKAGFHHVTMHKMGFGAVILYIGKKYADLLD